MAIYTVLFEKLYTIYTIIQAFFQNVQNNETFEIFRMFKNNSRINFYYTKSEHL